MCMLTFLVGAFQLEYKTIDDLFAAFKTSETLLEEFTACARHLVGLINANKYVARLRGTKKARAMEELKSERKKAASLVQKEGIRVKSKFKAIPVSKYMADHPHEDVKASGVLIRKLQWPGKGLVECVLLRKGAADECDVELETSLHAILTDELENGEDMLRMNQAKVHFDTAAGALGDFARHRDTATPFVDPSAHLRLQGSAARSNHCIEPSDEQDER